MTNLEKLFEQATARPWRINPNDTGYNHDGLILDSRDDIITYDVYGYDNAERDANARLIALAANHFEALVEALERTADVIGHNSCTDGNTPNGFVIALEHARAVLAAIEEDAGYV